MKTRLPLPFMAVSLLLLCSCASQGTHTKVAEKYGVSIESIPFIKGKWRNLPNGDVYYRKTLWYNLTNEYEEKPDDAMVALEISNNQTLTAMLLVDGVEMDSRKIKFKQRTPWLQPSELYNHYTANPALWYVIWGLGFHEVYLGIDANDDLCMIRTYHGGMMMITVVPTIIGGGGYNLQVHLYSRVE